MSKKNLFSCYLIGEDSLLIQCAEILFTKGHSILGVVSMLADIKEWAFKHGIPYFDSLKTAEAVMAEIKFDYLFSIINPYLISASLLKLPGQLAINYHDSLLPHYAGVHVTSWTILNNEKTHGITWHIMTEEIDEGDVLKQAEINIEDCETALSLNLKCYQEAITTFAELADELATKNIKRTAQDLSQRSYYFYNQKPQGNGWINWGSSAEDIDRLCRALSLGQYTNRLSLPKFILGDQAFVINKLQISLDNHHHAPPGTILEISNDQWRIATATQGISLLQISSPEGRSYSLVDLAERYNLRVGNCLPIPEISSYEKLEKLSTAYFKHEAFWVRELAQFKPATFPFLPLNLFAERNKKVNFNLLYTLNFPELLCQQLESHFSSDEPLSVVMLSLWLVYLYRMGNQNNLGVSLNNSQLPEDLFMFMSSQNPFLVYLQDEMCFEEVLKVVIQQYGQIKSHHSYLRDVVQRYPKLSLHDGISPIAVVILDEHQVEFVECRLNAAMVLVISADGKNLSLYVDAELVKIEPHFFAALNNIPGHLDVLLNAIVENKSQIIAKLPIMTAKERKQILIDWNQTTTDYPKDKTIPELFKEQVKKTPHNIAVSYESHSLTYSELDKKSDDFASYLQRHGLKTGERAAISTDQNLYFIIGLLAILKSGGIYVPVDPCYPHQHIRFILEDCNPNIILTNDKYKKIMQDSIPVVDKQIKIILLEEHLAITDKNEKTEIFSRNAAASKIPAYIMYTSGTTGNPKGVIVGHQAIIRLVKNTNYIEIKPHDRIAQAANAGFDAATLEIWGALLNGAHLVCVPKSILLDVVQFSKFLQQKSITVLWLTSALFNQYASACVSMFKDLTYLLVGGDVLNPERIKTLFTCHQGAPHYILNGYGPTENTTFSSVYLITEAASEKLTIPIGKPISNTTAYVLDHYLEPIPIGVIGELYVGGDGLAYGYLNCLELTQKKFVLNPFNKDLESKLYKTGDMVRWLPDGNLDYLGRQDNQIKIRGFRVELEAIQLNLLQHDSIAQCLVLEYENVKHIKSLAAYIIPREGLNLNISDVRDFMEQKLPFYMVPSFFVLLEKFPLNANGKIDIKLLPTPDLNQRHIKTEYKIPKTAIEKQLVNIWSELLTNPNIGVDDSFFDLGGHSLLLTELILLLEEKFKFKFKLYNFLEQPTVAHLAKLIGKKKNNKSTNSFAETLINDSKLDDSIKPVGLIDVTTYPGTILLTGATGFLGAHLLRDLHDLTQSKIYCLVRAKTKTEAKIRLEKMLKKYRLSILFDDRIIPVLGDLAEPNLGLSSTDFLRLAEEVDAIYHNGAYVHHLYNYDTLKAVNVLGTVEILKLATTHKLKQIHYLSTLSAVSDHLDENKSIIEDFVSTDGFVSSSILDGYSQTKLVSELLLSKANQRKIPVRIYRPGWILGQSETGIVLAENNHLLLLLKGCVQMGYAPEWKARLNILPVDFISKFIVKTSVNHKIKNKIFNMINPYSISWLDLIKHIKKRGYPINIVSVDAWKKKYLTDIDKNNAIFNLLPLYTNLNNLDWIKDMDTICNGNDSCTRDALEKANLEYPKITENLLDKYIDFLHDCAFIDILV